jgi:glyoxylase-like metal-dependent hydrolase (beta-lactamase superfamily II)
VVDPLDAFVDRYVEDAEERGATIEYAIDTHVHADHLSGLRDLAARTDATPVTSAAAVERGVTDEVETVADGDELAVGSATVEAVRAPGHTSGMTALAVGEALLTGDSLFLESVARPDLEEDADPREQAGELYRTLTDRFARFPDETVVAPGHHGEGEPPGPDGHTTSLGECRELPVFATSESEFVGRVTEALPPRPANAGRIVAINLGRENADGDEALELELGPNNCAATPSAGD